MFAAQAPVGEALQYAPYMSTEIEGARPTPALFKIVIQPIFILRDGDEIVGEQTAEPVVFYSLEKAKSWLESLPAQIAALTPAEQ